VLRAGVNVILQYPDERGRYVCRPYTGVPIADPVLVVLAGGDTPKSGADLQTLAAELNRQIQIAAPTVSSADPGCHGQITQTKECHAHGENRCYKLLVIVGDDRQALAPSPLYDWWVRQGPEYRILPVYPKSAQPNIRNLIPQLLQVPNVAWWTGSVTQTVPDVLARAGLTPESSRIFISYRQVDTRGLAIQLFDELAHSNFDVFLDHFRINPGVDFQVRLAQELGDKTMVLVLESEHYKDSEWTTYELNVAKECRLGLFALQMPGGTAPYGWNMPGIYDDMRLKLQHEDFEAGSFSPDSRLIPGTLEQIVGRIRDEHGLAMLRRRWILRNSMFDALLNAGSASHYFDGYGVLHVPQANGIEYLVWVTERPPELQQFHVAYQNCPAPSRGLVVGLARLLEPSRAECTNWLAGLCHIAFTDEGHMKDAAELMVKGAL
jgi:TIR domain